MLTEPVPDVIVALSKMTELSKFVTLTVKPSVVEVDNPKVGVKDGPRGIAEIVDEYSPAPKRFTAATRKR
jgi:hypothetical protein